MLVPTFIVKGAVKVIATGVEARGELDQVAGPGVPGSGETCQGDQLPSTCGEEVAVHATVIWKITGHY